MITIRKYKRLGWFDLLDRMEEELTKETRNKAVYFEFLDELRMRMIDSISKGASFKIIKQANLLADRFKSEEFASVEDLKEFSELANDIVG